MGRLLSVSPATDQISVDSSASSCVMSGRMEGRRRASMDLPAPGEPMRSTVVGTCGGDLQRALDVLLPHDVGKIGNAVRLDRRVPSAARGKLFPAAQMAQKLRRVLHAVDGQAVGQRRLAAFAAGT